jgi:hypothetical protein
LVEVFALRDVLEGEQCVGGERGANLKRRRNCIKLLLKFGEHGRMFGEAIQDEGERVSCNKKRWVKCCEERRCKERRVEIPVVSWPNGEKERSRR